MKALVTGITGQDGSYLVEHLLELGYEVHGVVRRSSSFNTGRIDHLYHDRHESGVRMYTHYGDLSDPVSLTRLLYDLAPDEIYNLGAQSHVGVSFRVPEYTFDITGAGTLRLLEAVREAEVETRIYQAGSSEMFGATPPPQAEASPFHPRSPYAVAKVAAHWMAVNYREAYGMFVSNGILFNHESPRRGETFVTRKITRAVARIRAGLQEKLYLGNLEAKRDWGYAPDYVKAMQLVLAHPTPDDWAFDHAGLGSYEDFVEIDPGYFRPAEVDALQGDASKARAKLGWEPSVSFDHLVELMVEADIAQLSDQLAGRVQRFSHEAIG
jgi:GDPmannose 4,6-dehydratase